MPKFGKKNQDKDAAAAQAAGTSQAAERAVAELPPIIMADYLAGRLEVIESPLGRLLMPSVATEPVPAYDSPGMINPDGTLTLNGVNAVCRRQICVRPEDLAYTLGTQADHIVKPLRAHLEVITAQLLDEILLELKALRAAISQQRSADGEK